MFTAISILSVLLLSFLPSEDIDRLKELVEETRGIHFKSELNITNMSQLQFASYMKRNSSLRYYEGFLRAPGKVLQAFDISSRLHKNCSHKHSNILGLYNEITHELVVVDRPNSCRNKNHRHSSANSLTLTHEMVHALADQHFSLSRFTLSGANQDTLMAIMSFVEGEATYFSMKAILGKRFDSIKERPEMLFGLKNRNVPLDFRQEMFLSKYIEGFRFVAAMFEGNGSERINELYENPPISTEQILHPEKVGHDFPREIKVRRSFIKLMESKGYAEVTDDVMGEAGIRTLLNQRKARQSERIAYGWDGDRYVIFESGNKDQIVLVWFTVWDTEIDRDQFYSYYSEYLKKNDRPGFLFKDGDFVLVVQNGPAGVEDDLRNFKDYISVTELREIEFAEPVVF